MIRKIIEINEEKCNGCGLCAQACHEGAIGMVNGKAKLLRDDYCDGLGDCLPACPTGAISFVEREADAYDAEAVKKNMEAKRAAEGSAPQPAVADTVQASRPHSCPGSMMRTMNAAAADKTDGTGSNTENIPASPVRSRLAQWPVQIKLAPVNAPYFKNASLLIAADCTAYAYARFHEEFMKGKITLIGCPKLDSIDYSEKLTEIIRQNDIRNVCIIRMEVPCCGGLEMAAKKALQASGKFISWQVVTISIDGQILD